MKKITQISLGLVAMSIMALFAACPGDGTGVPECKDTEKLNEISNTCIATCTDAEGCTDTAMPACILADANPNALVAGICGCTADSCAEDEVCHPTGNVCVKACDENTTCPDVGSDTYVCYDNETADAKVCQAPCEKSADCGTGKYSVCYPDDGGRCKESCVTSGVDCGTGKICNTDGKCVAGEGGECDSNYGDTTKSKPCEEAKPLCDFSNGAGECKAAPTCDDLTCAMEDPAKLCGAEEMCVALDTAPSAQCSRATSSTLAHTTGSPVIYEMSAATVIGACDNGAKEELEFKAKVYAPNGLYKVSGGLAASWFSLRENAVFDYAFAAPSSSVIIDNTHEVTFRVCLGDRTINLAVVNANKNLNTDGTSGAKTSNVFCFSAE